MPHDSNSPLGSGELAALIQSKDWAHSAVGAPDTWSPDLRTVLRLMLASRYAMWMGWGPDLTFFYNDAYAAQTLGAKHPWALGQSARAVWAEIWDAIGPRIDRVLSTGEATWDEGLLLFLERSGYQEETYHTFSYSPAPGKDGAIGGLFCVVIEETERVIGERRIALLRDLAALLGQTNAADDVLASVARCLATDTHDIPFSLTYLFDEGGKGARRALQTGFAAAHPAAPEHVTLHGPWALASLARGGAPVIVELDARHAWPTGAWAKPPTHALLVPIAQQGQTQPAGVFIAGLNPHRPIDEGLRSFVGLFVGQVAAALSNARAFQQEKTRAEALAEIDRAKTTFFSNVSHEFRTPLTLMLAPIEDMRAAAEGRGEHRERIELLHRNALRLLKLVNTLLDFSRIEAGRVEAIFEPTDLAALTADLASSFRSAVERAELSLVVECPALEEPIYVDRDMWEKIVLNLLSNAFKFTFTGSITVRLRLEGDFAALEVADTGTGIAGHELPRLFERFHRIEGAKSRSHEGSGIGLALVHELIRMHGGAISVTSVQGAGTTFQVRIPRGQSHLAAARIRAPRTLQSTAVAAGAYVEEALRWGSTAPDSASPPAVRSIDEDHRAPPRERLDRIVVADDNADLREYVTRLLRERWDVEAVSDGHAALDAIRRRPADLVLTDVMMPGLDGFGLLRAIRSDAELRATPVVLLSARAGEEATAEGLNAGADDYLTKPFTARELLVRVAARLATAKAARAAIEERTNIYRHFMQAPFPIAIFRGPTHVIELVNDACLRAWSKTTDVIGLPLESALPELAGQSFLDILNDVYRSGVPHEGLGERARFARGPENGTEDAYFNFVYAPLVNRAGVVEGLLTCAFDVTEQVLSRERVERARAEAEALARELYVTSQRLQAAQSVAGIGIFDWSIGEKSAYWSPELYALLGLMPGTVKPTPQAWNAQILEEDRKLAEGAFREATAARAQRMELEVRLKQPRGDTRWVRLSMQILYDGSHGAGDPYRVIGAVVDVQVLKEAAAARARALEEAERTNRAKDEFLATMSHELRTPLNAMLGWARILKAGPRLDEKVDKGLDVIERNARTQARLVSDLLDVSRIISGKLRLATKRIDLPSVILAAVDVVKPAADAKRVKLAVKIDADVGPTIADPDRLQQIVWNLLTNAVRFTPAGGEVTVSAARVDSVARIVVEDTGAGIREEHLNSIFDRFRQIDGSSTREHGGMGLGLSIVRYLVEAHGGAVIASSEGLGRGSRFTVTFPIRAVAPRADVEHPVEAGPIDARVWAFDQPPFQNVRALVVDDDRDSLELLRLVLEEAGVVFTGVSTAQQALDATGPFDLIISDIGMPQMDGYALIRRIRSRDAGGDVPAIALTAYARAEDAERAVRAGYQAHLAKPVDAHDLLETVARWTSIARAR